MINLNNQARNIMICKCYGGGGLIQKTLTGKKYPKRGG